MLAQLPAGFLTDRSRRPRHARRQRDLLAAGQLLLALSSALPLALLGRVLVGIGDAIVFVAVLALLPRWFPARRVPMVTQLTTILCQAGQILSAVPFLALLHVAGWTPPSARRRRPARWWPCWRSSWSATHRTAARARARGLAARDRTAVAGGLAPAGHAVGFFSHMAVQFSMNVFTLLWGVPWLVSAQGLSSGAAGALITLFVVCTIAFGPIAGALTTWRPLRRSRLVLVVVGVTATLWTVVLSLPGPAPRGCWWLLIVVLGMGGPASVVGIDIGRTSNPTSSLGVAQAVVNLGGFSASLGVLAAMGAVLTLSGGFTTEAFRLAWLVQYPVWAVGVACLLARPTHGPPRRAGRPGGSAHRPGPGPVLSTGPAVRTGVRSGAGAGSRSRPPRPRGPTTCAATAAAGPARSRGCRAARRTASAGDQRLHLGPAGGDVVDDGLQLPRRHRRGRGRNPGHRRHAGDRGQAGHGGSGRAGTPTARACAAAAVPGPLPVGAAPDPELAPCRAHRAPASRAGPR